MFNLGEVLSGEVMSGEVLSSEVLSGSPPVLKYVAQLMGNVSKCISHMYATSLFSFYTTIFGAYSLVRIILSESGSVVGYKTRLSNPDVYAFPV
jgi:hypothetical protein